MEFAHTYLPTNGIILHVAQMGPDEGPLVVLLHGFPEFWRTWRDYAMPLAKRGYRVWLPDLRGYNLSDRPQAVEAYALPTLADDIIGLLDAAGAGRAILAGHDWGGVVAWQVALQVPRRLEKLIVANAPLPAIFARELRNNPAQREAARYMDILRIPRAESILARDNYGALDRMVLAPGLVQGYFDEDDARAYRQAWSQRGALTGMVNYYRAMPLDALNESRIPLGLTGETTPPAIWIDHGPVAVSTLLFWGERDTALLPGNLDGLETYVPELTVRRFPQSTHWIVHEERDRVLELMIDFLSS